MWDDIRGRGTRLDTKGGERERECEWKELKESGVKRKERRSVGV